MCECVCVCMCVCVCVCVCVYLYECVSLSDSSFLESLAEFRKSVRKSITLHKKSITSCSIRECQRKASIKPRFSKSPKQPSLSKIPSRFSIVDIPVAGTLAAFSGRTTFPGPINVLDEGKQEYEDDERSVSGQYLYAVHLFSEATLPYFKELCCVTTMYLLRSLAVRRPCTE